MKRSRFLLALGLLVLLPWLAALPVQAQDPGKGLEIVSETVEIMSDGQAYPAYLAAPAEGGPYPGIVLIHSFRGLEEGYITMVDRFAAQGFVVLAIRWQTFMQSPLDTTMKTLVSDSAAYLAEREDVDGEKLGLTGFCAGGRYTMLLLPQLEVFGAGVAWYGFPNIGDPTPTDLIDELSAPMLIIHGTDDGPSPIADIYQYALALDAAGKDFELKVYSGEPHGFMLAGGQLRTDEVAEDALEEMIRYFQRKLGG
jgi:carboxymethylenebutenolidase